MWTMQKHSKKKLTKINEHLGEFYIGEISSSLLFYAYVIYFVF